MTGQPRSFLIYLISGRVFASRLSELQESEKFKDFIENLKFLNILVCGSFSLLFAFLGIFLLAAFFMMLLFFFTQKFIKEDFKDSDNGYNRSD